MKNKRKKVLIVLVIVFLIAAIICGIFVILSEKGTTNYPDLSENPIAFYTSVYVDINNDNEGYIAIEYNGRKYMPYGSLKRNVLKKDIDKCIGYVVQDENNSSISDENNKNTRIYTLKEDKENNFLMQYYIGTTLMNQPCFYRAADTKGKNIFIPKYINSLEYNYWK